MEKLYTYKQRSYRSIYLHRDIQLLHNMHKLHISTYGYKECRTTVQALVLLYTWRTCIPTSREVIDISTYRHTTSP